MPSCPSAPSSVSHQHVAGDAGRLFLLAAALIFGAAALARAQSAIDGFDPGANGNVLALAVQRDGKILAGGNFTALGGSTGLTSCQHIGRLNPDGSVDSTFSAAVTGWVEAIAVQPDGKILVAGGYSQLGGMARRNIARLNPDGTVDATFDPGANNLVRAIALQPDGKILVGGLFTTLGGGGTGSTSRKFVGRLNPDGSVDASFDPGANDFVASLLVMPNGDVVIGGRFTQLGGGGLGATPRAGIGKVTETGALTSFNPGANGLVRALAFEANGAVVAAGDFTVMGDGGTIPRNYIARILSNGTVDTTFDPGANGSVVALVVQPDGKIVVGGNFDALGGGTGATPRGHIGRLNPDGTVDAAFDPGADTLVSALALQPDGKIVAGGSFARLGGGAVAPRLRLARVYPGGSLDTTFAPALNGDVLAFALQPDGKIVIGGAFIAIGDALYYRIARLEPDGTVDADFNPGLNGTVTAVAIQKDGKVVVGGYFTSLGGGTVARNYLARLNPDGSVDAAFNPGADSFVNAVALQPDGKILVGGWFSHLAGAARSFVGRLNADGSIDSTFTTTANAAVDSIVLQRDGKIILAGEFTTINGSTRTSIARVNANGTLDASFAPVAGDVFAALVQPDGKVVVGGSFLTLNGVARPHIGRLNADGSIDTTFISTANSDVTGLALQIDGKILVSGSFSTLGDAPRNRIGRLNGDGSIDAAFDPGADADIYSMAIQPDGKLLVGGVFTTVGGGGSGTASRRYIARLTLPESAGQQLSAAAAGTVVNWTHGGAGPQTWRATLESSADAVTFTGLASAAPVAGGWQATGLTLPKNQDVYIRARGYYSGGNRNDSNGVVESVSRVFVSCPTLLTHATSAIAGGVFAMTGGTLGGIGRVSIATTGTLPAGMSAATGLPRGTPTQTGSFPLTVTVTDSYSGCSTPANLTLTVSCPVITLSATAFAAGTAGTAYPATAITQMGGVGTASFTVTSGSLPDGMTLSSAGVISGTPQHSGTFTFTVTATDVNGCTGTRIYTLTINCAEIGLSALPNGRVAAAYAGSITTTGCTGSPTFAVSSGTLPDGLTLSSAGVVSGTPATAGTFPFTVTATDTNGCTGTRAYALTIAGPPTMSLSPGGLNFGAIVTRAGDLMSVTPGQALTLTQSGAGTVGWTASVDQPWLTVTPASGTGGSTLIVSVSGTGLEYLPLGGSVVAHVTVTTAGAVNSPVATVRCTWTASETTTAPVGLFETPADHQTGVTGSIPLTGWTVDDMGVTRVQITRDAVPDAGEPAGELPVGNAVFVTGARPDVEAAYPHVPYCNRAGWGYMLLTNFLPHQGNGTFTLHAYAEDVEGHRTRLGSKTIVVDNASATRPFGAIDTPEQGATISGRIFNYGWALTPLPASIAADGSTIHVLLDSASIGTLDTYNNARSDIQTLFPGYANTDGAVGAKLLDTTALSNGPHTIAWIVTDDHGRTEGIGSRFFTVSNSSASGLTAGSAGASHSSVIEAPAVADGAPERIDCATEAAVAMPILRGTDPARGIEWADLDARGINTVRVAPQQPITVDLGVVAGGAAARYEGYELVNGDLRALPIGSTLDAATGQFTWAPGLAFGGTHTLVFLAETPRGLVRGTVQIAIGPRD